MIDTLRHDIRYGLRNLAKRPGFFFAAVLTLALGIGATTALFSVVHGVLLRALPFPDSERIVRVFEVGASGRSANGMSDPNFADLRERSRSFDGLAQFQSAVVPASARGEPMRTRLAWVSADFLTVMAVQPVLGRDFRDEERHPGAAPVVLVGHAYWQRVLGGETDLSTLSVRFQDQVHAVVGVLPPGFDFPEGAQIWSPREPLGLTPSRTALNWQVIGRLADGVAPARAQEDMSAIARELKREHGEDIWMVDARVTALHEHLVGRTRPALLLLMGAAALLLLIACANVVNLLLARMTSRRRELAVRLALGAGRARLLRQFLVEALLLSLAGALLGLLLAHWGVRLLLALRSGVVPGEAQIGIDGTVALFAMALATLVALILAALSARRSARADVQAALAGSQRSLAGAAGRLRHALVALQIALTSILLIGGGLLARSFLAVLDVDPGFRSAQVMAMQLTQTPSRFNAAEAARLGRFHESVLERLAAIPGVEAVGAVNALPLTGGGANGTFLVLNHPDEVPDIPAFQALSLQPERRGEAEFRVASEDYFRALSIPLLRGRGFDRMDGPDTTHVALVSESLAARQWPNGDAIGQLVQFGNMDGDLTAFTIVGVVGDVREASLESEPVPTFYGYYRQRPMVTFDFEYVLRGPIDAAAITAQARAIVRELAPEIPPLFRTFDQVVSESLTDRRFHLILLATFALAALALAVIGVYGVISFHVGERTRELAVRIAVGARAGDVRRLVLGQGALLVGIGLALGLAGALAVMRWMRSLFFGIGALDPVIFAGVPLLLIVVALVACWLPAGRASRVDPIVALRDE